MCHYCAYARCDVGLHKCDPSTNIEPQNSVWLMKKTHVGPVACGRRSGYNLVPLKALLSQTTLGQGLSLQRIIGPVVSGTTASEAQLVGQF